MNEPTYLRVARGSPTSGAEEHKVLTTEEVALELRVSVATVYRLMRAGRLAFIAVGRRRRVTRDQLAAFMAAATVDGVAS